MWRQLRFLWGRLRQPRGFRLFCFWDGTRWQRRDPLDLWRRIEDDPQFDPFDFDLLEGEDVKQADRTAALGRVVEAAYRCFDIPPYDGRRDSGVTQSEALALMQAFFAFAEALKKNISVPSISSPSTDSEPAAESAASAV